MNQSTSLLSGPKPAEVSRASSLSWGARRKGIPFRRVYVTELRKMVDTRSAFWLLTVILIVAMLFLLGIVFMGKGQIQTFSGYLILTMTPVEMLLPVIPILVMTAEWTHRTAMTTFALEPRRLRVLSAKVLAAMTITVVMVMLITAAVALTIVLQSLSAPAGAPSLWNMDLEGYGRRMMNTVVIMCMGLSFGVLFMNTPLAIVVYYIVPTLVASVAKIPKLREAMAWVDPMSISMPFSSPNVTGDTWAHAGVAATVWIVAPFVIGTWRMYRREIS